MSTSTTVLSKSKLKKEKNKEIKNSKNWKKGPISNTNQGRQKYTNACIKHITDNLPQKSFNILHPTTTMYPKSNLNLNTNHPSDPVTPSPIKSFLFESLHFTSGVSHVCFFCETCIEIDQFPINSYEQLHTRRRWTFMCQKCAQSK